MANFLLVADPDRIRRSAAAARAAACIRFLPHLTTGVYEGSELSVVWAANPLAPVSQHSDAGSHCLVLGEPLDGDGMAWPAAALGSRYRRDLRQPAWLNGFYAALFHDQRLGLRVEADVLGQFPVYYWNRGDVLLVASTPSLFRHHPLFSTEPDLDGVASLLLTSGLCLRSTLETGVRRLGSDHVLVRAPGGQPTESAPAPEAGPSASIGLGEAVERAAALHERFLRGSLANSRSPGLLLSGGLDSRILAGTLARIGISPRCLTFGEPGDLDARCASLVVEELGLEQTIDTIDVRAYPRFAAWSVTWEGLSGGLYAIPMGWNLAAAGAPSVDRIVCGLSLDAVIGGSQEIAPSGERPSFERLRVSRLGFTAGELDRLVREPDLAAACSRARVALSDRYQEAGTDDNLRTWRMNLETRHRFPVGSCAWRYSFHAWPVLPALDRSLIRLGGSLPREVSAGRRIQKAQLVGLFPGLAALDLDRNYFDTTPIAGPQAPSWRRRLFKATCHARALLGRDPRFYVRVMDFNARGWRDIRQRAEEGRAALGSLLDAGALAEILPDPGTRARRGYDPIIGSAPLKTAVGLMQWAHGRS
jgi:asparagine synthase (glutamine-hydrolysing)